MLGHCHTRMFCHLHDMTARIKKGTPHWAQAGPRFIWLNNASGNRGSFNTQPVYSHTPLVCLWGNLGHVSMRLCGANRLRHPGTGTNHGVNTNLNHASTHKLEHGLNVLCANAILFPCMAPRSIMRDPFAKASMLCVPSDRRPSDSCSIRLPCTLSAGILHGTKTKPYVSRVGKSAAAVLTYLRRLLAEKPKLWTWKGVSDIREPSKEVETREKMEPRRKSSLPSPQKPQKPRGPGKPQKPTECRGSLNSSAC